MVEVRAASHADLILRKEITHFVVFKLYAHVVDGTVLVLDTGHQLVEQAPRFHRQTATTYLLTRECRMIDNRALYTCLFQQATAHCASRTSTNDQHINLSQIHHFTYTLLI